MPKSISTISSPEFINLEPLDINPLMSSCEIKVLYIGQNRNRTSISKEVATEMSKTLRGAPIVGYYKEQKQDFADHGDRVVFDDEGVKFECMTKPYGFVAPDAKVWFQKFQSEDAFGNSIEREYLMTTGYLWTGQFEECKSVIEEGRPHSMEIDEESMKGNWSMDYEKNMEFFIINDATFSKLCILGEDVEPCFEESTITAPEISASFTKVDEGFKKTLYNMMQDLKFALEGGIEKMAKIDNQAIETPEVVETPVANTAAENYTSKEPVVEETSTASEYEKKDNEEEENKDEKVEDNKDKSDNIEKKKEKEKEYKKEKNKCSLDNSEESASTNFEKEYEELSEKYSLLEEECKALREFKNNIEDTEKVELISKFSMLEDADKELFDSADKRAKYSLQDIKKELSAICFDKGLNFTANKVEEVEEEEEEQVEEVHVTYTANDITNIPDWIKLVKENQN